MPAWRSVSVSPREPRTGEAAPGKLLATQLSHEIVCIDADVVLLSVRQ